LAVPVDDSGVARAIGTDGAQQQKESSVMHLNRNPMRRGLALAAFVATGIALTTASAIAGTCPADKMRPDGSGEKMNATPAKDVTDMVIGSIDVAKEPAAVKDRLLRLRKLEIKAGGVVPWHEHANRPAIIYIIRGKIVEHASTCAVPIVHRAGEVATETHATAHWWKNTGTETVVLLSSDLFPMTNADGHMM
jgi:quercetin dioxygenase-like cupin family protein